MGSFVYMFIAQGTVCLYMYIMISIYSVDELASILEAPVDHRQLALHVSTNAWLCYMYYSMYFPLLGGVLFG